MSDNGASHERHLAESIRDAALKLSAAIKLAEDDGLIVWCTYNPEDAQCVTVTVRKEL